MMHPRAALALLCLGVTTCNPTISGRFGPDASVSVGDGGPDGGGGPGSCDDAHPCATGRRCYHMACIPDNGTCQSDKDCQNDTYCDCTQGGGGDMGACMGGVCVPYGMGPRGLFNPDCTGQSFSSSDLKQPIIKCQWNKANVIDTPVLIDLDLDGKPEIVFSTYPEGDLWALHGKDCSEVWHKTPHLNNFGQVAAADLDGDKFPEIVATTADHKVVVFDHNGNQLAVAPQTYFNGFLGSDCTGPAIANLDANGPPHILVHGQVSRYSKAKGLEILFTNDGKPATWGVVSVFADLDGDGVPEAVTGLRVYDGKTGADKTPAGFSQLQQSVGAYPAIADFNKDKKPDIVLVQSQSGNETVSIWDWANKKFIFGPLAIQGGWGGPPTVADFDGDGVPDFGSAAGDNYFVFSMKCWPNGGNGCAAPGILWKKKTHDLSSGGTASSVFDFNGDGKAEVVYRDECFFRVYDGTTGKTDFALQITSGTCLENPVVGDVDNDGHADVVVPSDNVQGNGCNGASDPDTNQVWTTQTRGIFVLTDPLNRWMPSRAIWNEHSYHITNVKDDGTIPYPEKDNWTSWNNYRSNVQGMVGMNLPGIDLTGAVSTSVDNGNNDCKVSERLWAQICNRGTGMAGAGVAGAFYGSDPRKPGAKAVCTTATKMPLAPGACEAVWCDWKSPPSGPQDLWFRANDDGTSSKIVIECNPDNDILFLPAVTCFVPG